MNHISAPIQTNSHADSTQGVGRHLALGDLALTFGDRDQRLPQRHPDLAWLPVLQNDGWTFWQTETAAGWRGMPYLAIEQGPWRAWLVGELYGTNMPDQLVMDVLESRASAATLNGHFILLAWNKVSNEWHIWSNRHATLHGYLAINGTRVSLSTYLPAAAASTGRTELDWEGLTTFFNSGFFLGDWTHLVGARILRPATHYRFGGDGHLLEETRYWEWWHAPNETRTYDETVDAFAEHFGSVMADLTADGRIAVPISGGLDSRTTVATLPAGQGHDRLWAFSYGYSDDSVETAIAGRVAAERDLAFDSFTIKPYLFPKLLDITAAVEGFEDVTLCRQAAVTHEIDRQADYLIAAHLGDLYLSDMGLNNGSGLSSADVTAVALKKVHRGGSDWLLEHLCRPQLGGAMPEDVVYERVSGEMLRLAAISEPDFRVKAFKVDQWCARWTTVALRMYQVAAFPRLPFYDSRLEDFFCTVPTEMVQERRLQIDYLRRYAPDLARVPWQATGKDLFHDGRNGVRDLASRAISRGVRMLSSKRSAQLNWEVQLTGPEGTRGLNEWLLRPGLLLHEFIAPAVVAELLQAFGRDPYGEKRGYTVAMLLSFSAWLETHYRAIGGGQ